jgi:hypothetical protein
MITSSSPIGGSDHGLARPNHPLSMRERRQLSPSRVTKTVLSLAVAQLPPRQRQRYVLEFWAEIHDIHRDEQLRYALALLVHTPALRAAVSGARPPNLEVPMKRVDWQHLPCWLTLHHYMTFRSPEGELYVECSRCGKYRHSQGVSPAAWV